MGAMCCAEDTGKPKRKSERGGREERKTAPDTGVLETGMTSQTDGEQTQARSTMAQPVTSAEANAH